MRSITAIVCLLIAGATSVQAQQNPYDVALIPKDLLSYSSAVVRDKEVSIDVKDLENTVYHIKEVVTILNKNGDNMAHIVVNHDKNISIKNIKGIVYNSFGMQTSKFSESNFEDINTTDGFSLFEDVKIKRYTPEVTDYPYTIEYEYEQRIKGSLIFPDWRPNAETGVSVEKSSYTFICKPDFNIRYKEINIPTTVNITTDKNGLKTYTWQLSNLKAVKYEPFSPNPENYLSIVKIAPEKFSYYGIDGSFTNWNELGKWEYDNLIANRQELSDETINRVKEMTGGINDPKLKAKKIYEYMQGRTHYVSVQVGIGGYQPFLASDVDKLNYGDCKALVNYTQSLLKAVDIESYYCVVEGNQRKISLLADFSSMNQGNHIILCLPFKNDTTWCDCTSQTIPFGYLGSFTDDRNVLACTPNGGKLLHTPKYSTQNNLQHRNANFNIDEQGELTGDMITNFTGVNYTDREGIIHESPSERVKIMQEIYRINNMNIEKLEFKQDKSLQPVTTESIKIKAPEFASVDNGKIYFLLNPVNRILVTPKIIYNRATDVYINEGIIEEDEISYTLPAGYHLENKPEHRNIERPFGKYIATMKIEGNQLIYNRKFELINGTYSKDTYQDLVDFYQSVVDADSHNVILAKNN